MKKSFFYIANWKMYFSHTEALQFVTKYMPGFISLTQQQRTSIIFLPPADTLFPLQILLKETPLLWGAQHVGLLERGACSGQISVLSLRALGCQYALVGHSEHREMLGETDESVARRANLLCSSGITPLVCIGEDSTTYQAGKTLDLLHEQLTPLVNTVSLASSTQQELFICYEPRWAIGKDEAAPQEHIENVLFWLATFFEKHHFTHKPRLIYGGAVSSENSATLKKINGLDGFLLGRAGIDFQEFEKIVHYT